MKIIHKALGIDIDLPELKTRHVEKYFHEIIADTNNDFRAANIVRAAIKAGILADFDIEEAAPAVIIFLAQKIDAVMAEALTIPPE